MQVDLGSAGNTSAGPNGVLTDKTTELQVAESRSMNQKAEIVPAA